jgi:Ser/Thr protein kinase RdoA (MazF antagonist)
MIMSDSGGSAWGDAQTRFFFDLTPDRVLESVVALGLRCSGRCTALNSFENRVYEIELEPEEESEGDERDRSASAAFARRRVVKFYRPGRWNREQILVEDEFLLDLKKAEIPVVAPIEFPSETESGRTLHVAGESGIFFALFPKVGGRAPDELQDDQLRWIGRLLARVHAVGALKSAPQRIEISPETYGRKNLKSLLEGNWIPLEFAARYERAVNEICALSEKIFSALSPQAIQRIHGDCHLGNLLLSQTGPIFLDFDDMVRGPAVQDVWLLVSGRDEESQRQRRILLEGYEEMREFDDSTLQLIEPLRALRFIHYSAWIARRWSDPAFPAAFPQFGSHRYWQEQVQDLEQQFELIRRSIELKI